MLQDETPLGDMINDAIWSSIVKYGHLDSNKVLIAASLSTGIELNTIKTHYNYSKEEWGSNYDWDKSLSLSDDEEEE